MLVELDRREVPRTRLHWASTTDWYAHCAGTSRGRAKHVVRDAHDLVGDRRDTRAALRAGMVSPDQASVICAGVGDLPGDRMLRRRAETCLLEEATRLDATDLARAARQVLAVVDPDREDRRAEAELSGRSGAAHAQRFLAISDDGCGGVRIKGRGSLEDGAVLRAALLPLSAPEPAVDAGTGRSWIATRATTGAVVGRRRPGRPARSRHRPAPELPRRPSRASASSSRSPTCTPRPPVRARRAPRTASDLHPAVVRRLACDADVLPVVLGTDGRVLDVGRAHRTATEPIWRALVARDRHCTFPGCRRPPVMCQAHHVVHCADGRRVDRSCVGDYRARGRRRRRRGAAG